MDTIVLIELGKMLLALAALAATTIAAMLAAERRNNWRGI